LPTTFEKEEFLMQQPSGGWTPLIPFGGPRSRPKRDLGRCPIGLGSLIFILQF